MILSIILICLSSYIFTSVFSHRCKNNLGFIFFLLIAFTQIVLSFEVLSLLSAISKNSFLFCNIFFCLAAFVVLKLNNLPIYKPALNTELKKILKALKRDKLLLFISLCFVIFIISTLISVLYLPVTFADALTYYLTRCTSWIQNGDINHFITPDTRELIMPVNMEFLYTWLLLFTKTQQACGIFSYLSFLNILYVIYNFLGELGFSRRKRLWSIFVFSSFPLIGIMAYTPCADLFTGSLLLTGIYLFYGFVKTNKKVVLYFSTLAIALAMGTKTTAVIAILSIFLIIGVLLFLCKREKFKQNLLLFTGFLFFNFIFFSSYNYILNFIQYLNPISCPEQLLLNKFRGGIEGYLSNLIKYIFSIFDMSGIENIDSYNNFINKAQIKVLSIIGLEPDSYTSVLFDNNFEYNSLLGLDCSFLGALGLFIFLPSLVYSTVLITKKNISVKAKILSILAISLILNILIFSRVMVFTKYNMRYLITFVCLASPVIVFSYIKSNKNIFKWVFIYFMFTYLFVTGFTTPVAFFINYAKFINNNPDISKNERWERFNNNVREENIIFKYFISNQSEKKPVRIALMSFNEYPVLFDIEKLKLFGFHIDKILAENIQDYNLRLFDHIITDNKTMRSTMVVKFDSFKDGEKSVSKCTYLDYEGRIIEITDNKKPAVVRCEIPFDYIIQNGFNKTTDINLHDYVIFSKVKI